MDVIDLIVTIARNYKESIGIAPAKTKLLKLAYLAEVFYKMEKTLGSPIKRHL